MLYCLKCRKNTESKNPKTMLKLGKSCYFPVVQGVNPRCESRCPRCEFKFIKEQEASRLLTQFGIRTTLNKFPLLDDILF